ncbi:MAG: tetratricopeptide repeat protein [Lentisphaeria bacterium]|nr:tetratricopeptide repeat protein [Lentisphaeria bacterium]
MKRMWIATFFILGNSLFAEADFERLNMEAGQAAEAKNFVTAEAKYAEALASASDSKTKTQAILGKFKAMRGQKRIKEAEEFLLSRVEDPDIQLQDARQLLNTLAETMLWQKGREDCAMGILQQAQNCECPKSGNVFYQTFYIMAILYRNRAQYSAEIVVLENVLQVREQHPANLCTAHYMTGAAYEKLGNSEEALAHYRTALKFGKRVKYKYDYTKVEKAIERMCK